MFKKISKLQNKICDLWSSIFSFFEPFQRHPCKTSIERVGMHVFHSSKSLLTRSTDEQYLQTRYMAVNYLVTFDDITQTLSPSSYESSISLAEELLVVKHNLRGLSWKNMNTSLHWWNTRWAFTQKSDIFTCERLPLLCCISTLTCNVK